MLDGMLQLRFEACIAVLVFALCVLIVADPIRVANLLYRHPVAEEGDLFFTLAYRLIAIVGALFALYILTEDLWTLARA